MPREEILDDPSAAFPQLHQLLGAYFHQDWAADGQGWETVVDDFIRETPGSAVAVAAAELRGLLASGFSDGDLEVALEGLGGSVVPSAFGMTTTAWLDAVLRRLGSSA